MKSSTLTALLIAAVSLIWILSGVVLPSSAEDKAGAKTEEKELMAVRVRDSVAEDFVNKIRITGRTQATQSVDVQAEIEGLVKTILLREGTIVEEGDILARLEERDLRAVLDEARERVGQRALEFKVAEELETEGFNSRVRLAQAKADLETARAQLKKAEENLDNIDIRAPFGGIIHARHIEIGDFVDKGQLLFTIVDLDPLEVQGYVTEHKVAFISTGDVAHIKLIDGQDIEGVITYIAPAAEPDTRTFAVKVEIMNPGHVIKSGMTADIYLPMPAQKAHQISPSILTLDDDGVVGVRIVDDNNQVHFKPVTIVSDHPDHMWIEGLPDQARIITVGQDFVVDGQFVKPVPSDGEGLL